VNLVGLIYLAESCSCRGTNVEPIFFTDGFPPG